MLQARIIRYCFLTYEFMNLLLACEFYLFVNYFVQVFHAYHYINMSRFNLILTGMTLRSLLKRVTCFISQFICNNILSHLDGTMYHEI